MYLKLADEFWYLFKVLIRVFQFIGFGSVNYFRKQIEDKFTVVTERFRLSAKRCLAKDNHAFIDKSAMDQAAFELFNPWTIKI